MLLKELSYGLKHLFFPTLCEGCKKPLVHGEKVICFGCESCLPFTNYHHISDNETVLRLSGRLPFRYATSLAYFSEDGLLQHLIHGLKYQGKKQNGVFLGKELGKVIMQQNWSVDIVIPVPIHKKKEVIRGYNQSDYIAEGVAGSLKVPYITNAVVRKRFTTSQTDKSREERIQNVRDAFAVAEPELLQDKHILLVDDVLTTGATLEACAETILKVAGTRLSFATLGIAN